MHPLKYQVRHCCDAEQYEYQHARGDGFNRRKRLLVALCLFEDFVALDGLHVEGGGGIKNTRYAISAGLIAEFAGILASIAVAYVFFG